MFLSFRPPFSGLNGQHWGKRHTLTVGPAGRPAGPRGRAEGTPRATHLSGSSFRRGRRGAGETSRRRRWRRRGSRAGVQPPLAPPARRRREPRLRRRCRCRRSRGGPSKTRPRPGPASAPPPPAQWGQDPRAGPLPRTPHPHAQPACAETTHQEHHRSSPWPPHPSPRRGPPPLAAPRLVQASRLPWAPGRRDPPSPMTTSPLHTPAGGVARLSMRPSLAGASAGLTPPLFARPLLPLCSSTSLHPHERLFLPSGECGKVTGPKAGQPGSLTSCVTLEKSPYLSPLPKPEFNEGRVTNSMERRMKLLHMNSSTAQYIPCTTV